MNRTNIEWCDYTLNPVKGKCPMACPYCYARRMYDRFKWDPEIRYEDPFWQFYELKNKPPSTVFVGSTMELFGDWIRPEWHHGIFSYCRAYPEHSFLFLTKLPQNLPMVLAQIGGTLPENCWVGVTATTFEAVIEATKWLAGVKANIKYLSLEPLLDWQTYGLKDLPWRLWRYAGVRWLIIGQQTPATKKTEPKIEWVKEIVEAADKAGIKVFLKDNLKPLLDSSPFIHGIHNRFRQELPG